MRTRWQPTRAGLLNVWRYFDEVLTFEDGRLLLRGRNGSGKSKALELLLPFLLDANQRASRLSTFGSGDRTMHWNLMGQGASGATRVGYVWLELGRSGPRGDEAVTIGARLQASKSDSAVRTAYFIVSAQVGVDLDLKPDHEPLTAAALRAAVGGRGEVYEGDAAGYRAHVRALLFPGLEAERYESLVQALLQLRRPKLSERLDPENLSAYLSSALPPVDATRIEELAEGFERLDQRREELAALTDEIRAARSLLDATRTYGSVLLRERARAVTAATTDVDATSRAWRDGQDALRAAQEHELRTQEELAETAARVERTSVERSALQDSDAYREGRDLVDLRSKVRQSAAVAARSSGDATATRAREAGLLERAATASREASRLSGLAVAARAEALRTARVLGIEPLVGTGDVLPRLDVMSRHVQEVTQLLDDLDRATLERDQEEAARTRAQEVLAEAAVLLADARAEAETQQRRMVEDLLTWARSCTDLTLDQDALLAALDEDGLAAHVQAAVYEHRRVVERFRDEHERRRHEASAEIERLTEERRALAEQENLGPQPSRFRTPSPSTDGDRFWRLVDFQANVPDDDRAAIESALESSGILDGRLLADGALEPAGHDTVVVPGPPIAGPRLSDVLRPDVPADSSMPVSAVMAVLDTVALARPGQDGHARATSWVAADGSWGLGVARGAWMKPAAQYLGATARERHRLARLAQLDLLLDDQRTLEAHHAGAVREADSQDARIAAEADRLPSTAALAAARRAIEEASLLQAERARVETEIARTVAQARATVHEAHERVLTAAAERRLPTARHELKTVDDTVTRLRREEYSRQQAENAATTALGRETEAVTEAEQASEEARRRQDVAAEDARVADEDKTRLRTLEERLGDAYEDVVGRIAELTAQLEGDERRAKELADAAVRAGNEVIRRESAVVAAEVRRHDASQVRDDASRALVTLHRTTLAADAGIVEPLPADAGITAVLEEARRLDRTLPATRPNDTATLAQNRLYQRAHDTGDRLARRARLELEPEGDVVLPVATLPGRRLGVAELLHLVEREEAQARDEITEREHELFERALTGDTRRHLSQTIREADALVNRMNQRLETVETASGVRVRLRWDVREEEGTGLRSARDLLLRNPALLTEDEHDALHTFFRERIDAAHAQDSGRSWAQQLATVFDYTQWHRFRAQLFRPDGGDWRTLTKRVHSVLSGGEKAIALHLPLFAALAAHYEASTVAPRLILLDEVFVGIDEMNRGQIFALLRDLDLDLVLTSDHEWATYAEVPAIAIHQLATGTDDEAVTTTRFVWHGGQLVQEEVPPTHGSDPAHSVVPVPGSGPS